MKRDPNQTEQPFLSVDDAEIVHGPDVVAGKVSEALADADRFDLPDVKPPLSEALGKVRRAAAPAGMPENQPAEQDALSGRTAATDETAGSAEKLKPGSETPGS